MKGPQNVAPDPPSLQPSSSNPHYLATPDGKPFFLQCSTEWSIAGMRTRSEVVEILDKRKGQLFNAIAVNGPYVTNWDWVPGQEAGANRYGDTPWKIVNAKPDPTQPMVTPGSDPSDAEAYDYWDHLDYVVDEAARRGMYVLLLPAWGKDVIVGYDYTTSRVDLIKRLFDTRKSYLYGQWIGNRYKERSHIIWIMGGDWGAVYWGEDFRPVYRAMAEGVADGVSGVNKPDGQADWSTTLMSYHPAKEAPRSSAWFHNDPWLDFNSIQAGVGDQVPAISGDYALLPIKPTWLFEGQYETYFRLYQSSYKKPIGDAQVRYQAYQTVFAGGFGHTYGHIRAFQLTSSWREDLDAPGAWDMPHLYRLMREYLSDAEFLSRMPDQDLIDGDQGAANHDSSDRLQACRGANGGYALIYSANGRSFRMKMDRLAGPAVEAFWFDPRSGRWYADGAETAHPVAFARHISAGAGAPTREFHPPGAPADGNDWVLVLRTSLSAD